MNKDNNNETVEPRRHVRDAFHSRDLSCRRVSLPKKHNAKATRERTRVSRSRSLKTEGETEGACVWIARARWKHRSMFASPASICKASSFWCTCSFGHLKSYPQDLCQRYGHIRIHRRRLFREPRTKCLLASPLSSALPFFLALVYLFFPLFTLARRTRGEKNTCSGHFPLSFTLCR